MKGIEISVTNSDLIIKQEQRLVKLFVIFKDNKYGTKYIIFTDNVSNDLYYGSPIVNGNKMIIMKFKEQKDEELIKQFIWDFLNNNNQANYELIEIPKIEKLEIIDNNSLEVKDEYIEKLNDIFFKKEDPIIENKEVTTINKKSKAPILFSLVLLLITIVGCIYLINNKELIIGKNIYVECRNNYNIEEISTTVKETVTLTFNNSQKLKQSKKEITYNFKDNDKYYEFKEKNLKINYVKETGEEIFSDNDLSYKVSINHNLNKNYKLPKDYNKLIDYYKNNNYSCNNIGK